MYVSFALDRSSGCSTFGIITRGTYSSTDLDIGAVVGCIEEHTYNQQLVLRPRLHVHPVDLSGVFRPSDL